MSKVIVKQQEGADEIPTEIIAQHIEQISRAMRKFEDSRLKRRVLILLLKDLTGLHITQIELILSALSNLERNFIKPAAIMKAKANVKNRS